jgi:mycothiol synthase
MTIRFDPFDPTTASPETWARFHRFRRLRQAESRPEDPPLDDATTTAALKNEAASPEFQGFRFAIVDGADPEMQIGNFVYGYLRPESPSYPENHHSAQVQIAVLAPWRRRGIGRQVLGRVHALMREHGHSVILGATSEADGKAFARAIGADEALAGRESRLDLGALDWPMVEGWIAEGAARSPEARILFFERVPESIIEPFCTLYTETFNQQPLGDLSVGRIVFTPELMRQSEGDMARMDGRRITAVIEEADGALAGLTEIFYLAGRPSLAQQGLTGVRDAYRGAGKGKWLKAAMLDHVRHTLPAVRTLSTDNATDNAPMRAINAQLGFRLHRETLNVQMEAEALERYLDLSRRSETD